VHAASIGNFVCALCVIATCFICSIEIHHQPASSRLICNMGEYYVASKLSQLSSSYAALHLALMQPVHHVSMHLT
jgi:hypothetical protein